MIIVADDAGFIGSNIVKVLNDKGVTDVLVVDNLRDGTGFMNLVDLDIADYIDKEDFLIQIMANGEFGDVKAIFHEDAYSSTTEWDGKHMMDNNYQYSRKLLYYYLECEIPLLYTSSAATYNGRTSDSIESCEYEKLLNVYDYSKFLFDKYVRQILLEANSWVVGFCYFNVHGPRGGHKGNMASVAFRLNTQLNKGESPKLFEGNKDFKRDFVYVGDMADVNLQLLESGISGIFNLGTGRTKFFQVIADATPAHYKKDQVEYIPFPDKLKDRCQAFIQTDLANLCAAGCDKPFKIVAEGVMECMTWLNRNA